MDLGTIAKQVENAQYQHFEEFLEDVQLVWANCKAYNQQGSDIYRKAESMDRRAKKLARDLRTHLKLEAEEAPEAEGDGEEEDEDDDDFGFDPERYVPFDEKAEFAELIKRVTKEGLTQVVTYLLEKQQEAVDDFGNDRLQLRIDFIEREAFNHCLEILLLNQKESSANKRMKKE